ncbi:hypothetical protein G4X40_21305 [Rhodococcus sp. D2-41]|uniref:Uncharacterized protein n=1 Tax=Speluncibacter jeojiensis TaxID=2710754 RepID=A0A9X4M4S8_9ACTN|nr:hypothetical protein [Rhodococcus sp. D2-41]MDG3012681.1 hypothetical protein [Rhodococcus sp. D2-41]MDG3015213.1 hypothetical protein [Corynebacteriales bacterium D3-21]
MVDAHSSGVHTLACAVIRGEFDDTAVDARVFARIRDGDIDVWIEQIEATGLFTELEIHYLRAQWSDSPELLVAALIGDLDEVRIGHSATALWGRSPAGRPDEEWPTAVNG